MLYSRGIDLRISQMGQVIIEADSEDLYFMHKFGGYKDAPDWVILTDSYVPPTMANGEMMPPNLRIEYRAKRIPLDRVSIRRMYVNMAAIGLACGAAGYAVMSITQLFGM